MFIQILPALVAEADAEERALLATGVTPVHHGAGSTAAGLIPGSSGPNAFENIAMAHREIYALYEIAQ